MSARIPKAVTAVYLLLAAFVFQASSPALNVDKLSDADIAMRKQVIAKLEPLIQKRDSLKNLATLTFDELYEPLNKQERKFLDRFRHLKKKEVGVKIPWRGISQGETGLVMIKGQVVKEKKKVLSNGKLKVVLKPRTLPPQFLPRRIYEKYVEMMDAMEKDIGKRLYVESGYRSSAFQLYLFVYYLKNHDYSIKETAKFVALPGYSEHGDPKHQAIDFINENGINGDPNVEEFEVLPEYKWLQGHAHEFGFVLSYPKTGQKGITYEPWHWRYDPQKAKSLKSPRG